MMEILFLNHFMLFATPLLSQTRNESSATWEEGEERKKKKYKGRVARMEFYDWDDDDQDDDNNDEVWE